MVCQVAYVKALGAMGSSAADRAGQAVARVALGGPHIAREAAEEALEKMQATQHLFQFLRDFMRKPVRVSRGPSHDASGRRLVTADDIKAMRGKHVVTHDEEQRNRELREAAAKRLAAYGQAAEPVLVKALIGSANDRFECNDSVCGSILDSLSKVGLRDPSHVRPLLLSVGKVGAITYPSPSDLALCAIAKLGSDAIEPLVDVYLSEDVHSIDQYLVEEALQKCSREGIAPVVLTVERLREGKDQDAQERAERLLRGLRKVKPQ